MGIDWKNVKSFLYESKFVILLYVIGDWLTTAIALPVGMEYNSVPAAILGRTGIGGLLVVKLIFMVALYWAYITWTTDDKIKRWKYVKHFIEFVGIFAIINNLMVVTMGSSLIQIMGLIKIINYV
jgi:hypothetical protein